MHPCAALPVACAEIVDACAAAFPFAACAANGAARATTVRIIATDFMLNLLD